MSGRTRGTAGEAERRSGAGHRVHFEALVAVGGLEGGAGFEAESVDVSADGMRLRTAYLPVVGDRLVCRFDGLDGEVIVEGEVIWSTEESRGGEFALRFVDLDDETREMLKQLCVLEDAEEAAPKKEAESLMGTRVKLHIEGLGSPMKARVRSGDERELSVGSSLEFLKLGRTVELEDVDRNKRRDGYVDSVKVEIDPASSIPQLVVSLRFDGVRPELFSAKSGVDSAPKTKPGVGPMMEPPPKTMSTAALDATMKAATMKAADRTRPSPTDERNGIDAADATETEDDEMLDFGKSKLRVAGEKAKHMTEAAVGKVGPALAGFGAGAQRVWAKVGDSLQKRRDKVEEHRKANAPRRVTAPAPGGALKASGKKLVREDDTLEPESTDMPRKSYKKGLLGAALGLVVVAGGFGMVKAMTGGAEPAKKPTPALEARAGDGKDSLPAIPNAGMTGDVPLFGATPLSTTETVPPPVPTTAPNAKTAKADADGEGDGEDGKGASPVSKQWGQGEVSSPRVLKIKMDGPIAGISGEETEGGFTIRVPGRKSISSSSGLARKDKRLQAVDVTNHEDAADVMVKFKGDVPSFLAKGKGDVLEIAIGGAGSAEGKKVAAKSGKKKKGSKKSH